MKYLQQTGVGFYGEDSGPGSGRCVLPTASWGGPMARGAWNQSLLFPWGETAAPGEAAGHGR
jgi:hypothetical protein